MKDRGLKTMIVTAQQLGRTIGLSASEIGRLCDSLAPPREWTLPECVAEEPTLQVSKNVIDGRAALRVSALIDGRRITLFYSPSAVDENEALCAAMARLFLIRGGSRCSR